MKKTIIFILLILSSICLFACKSENGSKIKINPDQGQTTRPGTSTNTDDPNKENQNTGKENQEKKYLQYY